MDPLRLSAGPLKHYIPWTMTTDSHRTWFLGALTENGNRGEELHYESDRLTTHGVIVGMTGSGKTGLSIIALEEALLDGIPCLVIDPKGDMGNLLLNFPSFDPADFRPWIDEGQAKREGITPDELAANTAGMWEKGLAGWNIDSDRMRSLGTGAGFSIYTPGSTAGIPLNVLGSLAAPDLAWCEPWAGRNCPSRTRRVCGWAETAPDR